MLGSTVGGNQTIVVQLLVIPRNIIEVALEAIKIAMRISQTVVNCLSLEKTLRIRNLIFDLRIYFSHNRLETLLDCVLSDSAELKSFAGSSDLKLSDSKFNNKIRMENMTQTFNRFAIDRISNIAHNGNRHSSIPRIARLEERPTISIQDKLVQLPLLLIKILLRDILNDGLVFEMLEELSNSLLESKKVFDLNRNNNLYSIVF